MPGSIIIDGIIVYIINKSKNYLAYQLHISQSSISSDHFLHIQQTQIIACLTTVWVSS